MVESFFLQSSQIVTWFAQTIIRFFNTVPVLGFVLIVFFFLGLFISFMLYFMRKDS